MKLRLILLRQPVFHSLNVFDDMNCICRWLGQPRGLKGAGAWGASCCLGDFMPHMAQTAWTAWLVQLA